MTFDSFKLGVTAHEVASLAKVSQSAVSRTFTPGASVSDATREKVLQAAKKLGYRPNALARSLITRRSHMIALVMSYLENQFYPLVIEKLSQKLQQQGYHLLMFISDEAESDGVLAEILQYQVDGIVMASTMLSADMAKSCADFGVQLYFLTAYQTAPRLKTVSGQRAARATPPVRSHQTTTMVAAWWRSCCLKRGTKELLF